jgi:hypothetical protein
MGTNYFKMRLSQGQLNLLETCPPKFQQVYLERFTFLPHPEQQENLSWGNCFHLLMQQRELGLPVESLLQENEELNRAYQALAEAAPEILVRDSHQWREAEHTRTLGVNNYLLTVIYDLLIADSQQARIFDWKTYLKPQNKTKLAKNWQTRLYLYLLAETSEYLPDRISMTYWFVKLPNQPKSLTFNYSQVEHQKTQRDLTKLLTKLDDWLEAYWHQNSPFPHAYNCRETCPYFDYFFTENNSGKQQQSESLFAAIAEIEEIPL